MQKLLLPVTRLEVDTVEVCKAMSFFMTFVSLMVTGDKHFGVWSQVTQLINEYSNVPKTQAGRHLPMPR